jgi:hypothetical protein
MLTENRPIACFGRACCSPLSGYSHLGLMLSFQPLCNTEVSFLSTVNNRVLCIHLATSTARLFLKFNSHVMALYMYYCSTTVLFFMISRLSFVLLGKICYRLLLRILISAAAAHIVCSLHGLVYGRK